MIHLTNIEKSFGSLEVLKGIDLEINKGEVVSIVGPVVPERPPCCRLWEHSTGQTLER